METSSLILIPIAGLLGGIINGIVGSGTLLVFPVLVAAGIPPITANGTNTTGLCLGNISAAWAYRRQLVDRWRLLVPLALLAVVGSVGGVFLVLAFPEKVFMAIVPWLILGSAALVALQPLLRRLLSDKGPVEPKRGRLSVSVGLSSIYAGYFGAGQGVIYMAVLGAFYDSDPQRANAAKNLFAGVGNLTAAVAFIVVGRVYWPAVALIMPMAVIGGIVGARLAQRMSTVVLRWMVVGVGVVAAASLLVRR